MESTLTPQRVADALLAIDAVHFKPDAPIRFKSGILSPVYVDNRSLIFHPAQWRVVIEAFHALVERQALPVDVVAGVAAGGIPHSSVLAYQLQKPSVFVRKESKEHGLTRLVEGGDVAGQKALLVEDLITTGGSSLRAVNALRDAGAVVQDILAIVSYGFQESKTAFKEAGVRLFTLTDFAAILAAGQAGGRFGKAEAAIIDAWLQDPYHWQGDNSASPPEV